jgi:hypothetical protein
MDATTKDLKALMIFISVIIALGRLLLEKKTRKSLPFIFKQILKH